VDPIQLALGHKSNRQRPQARLSSSSPHCLSSLSIVSAKVQKKEKLYQPTLLKLQNKSTSDNNYQPTNRFSLRINHHALATQGILLLNVLFIAHHLFRPSRVLSAWGMRSTTPHHLIYFPSRPTPSNPKKQMDRDTTNADGLVGGATGPRPCVLADARVVRLPTRSSADVGAGGSPRERPRVPRRARSGHGHQGSDAMKGMSWSGEVPACNPPATTRTRHTKILAATTTTQVGHKCRRLIAAATTAP
jgi:hypothetical protein